ncbi:hypothetical protein BS17DRAFT_764715 [Gyrodon lividus]|nr:hypothetical protein BS17DRAFT_764715 [Gyrodon lividus]
MASHLSMVGILLAEKNQLGFTQVFSGFVAYGISFYDGAVLVPYKIVYFLLGGLAILVALIVLLWFPDSPVTWRMLAKEERVRSDQGVLATMLTDIPSGVLLTVGIPHFRRVVEVISVVVCGWYSDRNVSYSTGQHLVGSDSDSGRENASCNLSDVTYARRSLNETNERGVLLFGALKRKRNRIRLSDIRSQGTYLIGTFGSTLSTICAYDASNTSGYTKKVGVASLLRHINVRLNRTKLKALEELKASRSWSDDDVRKERERRAFADLTDKQ